ncbi:MAG: nitroreductase family protein [Bdellovibrionales bacterium]
MEQIAKGLTKTAFQANVMDAIYSRRSTREYTNREVSRQAVEELIGAAIQAPSAMNSQPWAFVVIQDPALLREICQEAKELLKKSSEWRKASEHGKVPFTQPEFDIFYGATTLITICAQKDGFQPVGDCYLAAENLMLAATALGLATCPIGFARDVLKSKSFRERLAIPGDFEPVLPIIVGYSAAMIENTPRNPPKIFSWKMASH